MRNAYFALVYEDGSLSAVMETNDLRTLYYSAFSQARWGSYVKIFNRQARRFLLHLGNVEHIAECDTLSSDWKYWMNER